MTVMRTNFRRPVYLEWNGLTDCARLHLSSRKAKQRQTERGSHCRREHGLRSTNNESRRIIRAGHVARMGDEEFMQDYYRKDE
jgi:hypothetical protein